MPRKAYYQKHRDELLRKSREAYAKKKAKEEEPVKEKEPVEEKTLPEICRRVREEILKPRGERDAIMISNHIINCDQCNQFYLENKPLGAKIW